ncbi:MAG: hypothetical protein EHM42_04050 [Planctomycetaceae bacterium]|nr:MAG: hypothetical protein EHM42_04050 [Planctomycetaceae bacterium]
MHTPLAVLCVAAALSSGTRESTVYTDYREAWRAAQARNLPILVILNPGEEADEELVDLELLQRSQQRRELLSQYVVAVIDTSTPEGAKTHQRFASPQLPRVTVIDKLQKLQIYRAAAPRTAEDWNMVLVKYKAGLYIPPPPRAVVAYVAPANCFT